MQWQYFSTFAGHDGLYNSYLDEYYCSNERACLHEQGHSEDRNLGWYSKTPEFANTINTLLNCKTPGLLQLPYIQFAIRNSDQHSREDTYSVIYSITHFDKFDTLKDLLENHVSQC